MLRGVTTPGMLRRVATPGMISVAHITPGMISVAHITPGMLKGRGLHTRDAERKRFTHPERLEQRE